MRLGVHISLGGLKIYQAFEKASELGCNTIQFFSRNPQRWRNISLSQEELKEFVRQKKNYDIKPIFVHIPYLINLASPNPRLYKDSIKAYIEDILEAQAMQADYIVTHMGSHKDTTEYGGLKRLGRALKKILKNTAHTQVGVLLENTAGSGSWLGYKFSHMKRIINELEGDARVGICLDTAHAFEAGYDISSSEGLESLLQEIDTFVGLSRLRLIHLNDSQTRLGSHNDRHQHIGKGYIGLEGMRRIVNHPLIKDKPFILETPKDKEDADRINLEVVRGLTR